MEYEAENEGIKCPNWRSLKTENLKFKKLNPIKAGGGRLAPPPSSFFALALSFLALSP